MADIKIKYGVNQFINEVSIEILGETDLLKSPKYKYVVEFVEGASHNGNGHQFMKIYTDGELEVLRIGNWKISPIVKMPFNWSGYWVDVEICDLNDKIANIKKQPDSESLFGKKSFVPDIKYVFESINELLLVEDKEHFDVLANIKETARLVDIVIDVWKGKPVPFSTIAEKVKYIENSVLKYEKIKDRLKPESAEYLKLKLNSAIDTFNRIEAELVK